MIRLKRCLILLLITLLVCPLTLPSGGVQAQEGDDRIVRLMSRMSTADKVGQLFLVTFPGDEVTDDAAVATLIREYRVGGVLLHPGNGNIVNEGDTWNQVSGLIAQLQRTVWQSQVLTQPVSGIITSTQVVTQTNAQTSTLPSAVEMEGIKSTPSPFVPLFIAVNHEGNGMPHTSIVNGVTPLPSQMALGASWKPEYAEAVGNIAGQELRALGVNMLLGPSLDVLEAPRPSSSGDLGVRSFGGEPFWVGQMGKAYIRGIHSGAEGRIAVIAKHFPGLGASDRSLDEEVSTVQRTLEKLRQVDLVPFAATAQSTDPLERLDGVVVSHIRFRGLEGGRFTTTGPVSVDAQTLQRLLSLPEMAAWREQGGVTVSDALGLRALKRYYSPNEGSFNSRRIAQDAFLAGNDLLLLSHFALEDDWASQIANVKSTITFFQEKYETDPSFQILVDAAVARILRLKLSLYGDAFELAVIQPGVRVDHPQPVAHQEIVSTIGRDAVTLLSPPSADLSPPPPTVDDRIVIFTDGRERAPCATCEPRPYVDPTALRDTIVRLYGPEATGQIDPALIFSFTFDQLEAYMNMPTPTPTPTPEAGTVVTATPAAFYSYHPIESALQVADWVIFATLDLTSAFPQSIIVRRFLAERADALRTPYLIVMSYDAPYYLDATEISKLDAYYVAYSHINPFIEASIRTLFGEFAPPGAPPVSVSGVNYDLVKQTSPDPNQTITLSYYVGQRVEENGATPTPTSTPTLAATEELAPETTPESPRPQIGDELRLRSSVIVDHNGHPVPDGTPVKFIFSYPQEGLEHSLIETTRGGVVETAVVLERTGQLDISVQADPVPRTVVLQIKIPEGEQPVTIVTITPTPTPTPVTPTETPSPSPKPATPERPTATPTPQREEEPLPVEEADTGGAEFLFASLIAVFVSGIGYTIKRLNKRSVSKGLRLALWCTISGLTLYLVYVLGVPGAHWLRERGGIWATALLALLGGVLPIVASWLGELRRRVLSRQSS